MFFVFVCMLPEEEDDEEDDKEKRSTFYVENSIPMDLVGKLKMHPPIMELRV